MAEVERRPGARGAAGRGGGGGTGGLPGLMILVLLLAACAPGGGPPTAPGAGAVFPGFDTWRYPGDEAMRAWRAGSPYGWVGVYLASPCHRDESWMGRRSALEAQGWGVALLYVGQQAFEGQPTENPGVEQVLCSSTLLTAEQGRADGRDAVAKAAAEGYARGSVIFLDVERMESTPPAMIEYLRAWTSALLSDGSYLPGLYAHRANAADLYLVAAEAYRAAGRSDGPPYWVAGGSGFSLEQPPQAAGLPFVNVWQGALDVTRSWGGVTLEIDENVADRPSPSAPPEPDRESR